MNKFIALFFFWNKFIALLKEVFREFRDWIWTYTSSAGGGESGEYAKQEKKILVTSEEGVLTLEFLERHFNDASLKLTIEVTEVKEGLGTLTKRVEAMKNKTES